MLTFPDICKNFCSNVAKNPRIITNMTINGRPHVSKHLAQTLDEMHYIGNFGKTDMETMFKHWKAFCTSNSRDSYSKGDYNKAILNELHTQISAQYVWWKERIAASRSSSSSRSSGSSSSSSGMRQCKHCNKDTGKRCKNTFAPYGNQVYCTVHKNKH